MCYTVYVNFWFQLNISLFRWDVLTNQPLPISGWMQGAAYGEESCSTAQGQSPEQPVVEFVFVFVLRSSIWDLLPNDSMTTFKPIWYTVLSSEGTTS